MAKRLHEDFGESSHTEYTQGSKPFKKARFDNGPSKRSTENLIQKLKLEASEFVPSVIGNIKSNSSSTNKKDEKEEKKKKKKKNVNNNKNKKTIGLSETLSIEHAIGNLKAAIKTILTTAPNSKKLQDIEENTEGHDAEVLLALKRSKLALASKLKSLYEDEKLPLFDQILEFEENNKVLRNDVEIKLDEAEVKKYNMKIEDKTGFPELPPIKDYGIRAQVFLHKSLVKDKLFLSKNEVIHTHNERLEFIGDSVLNNIMTLIVYNAFPYAEEGELSQLRTRLISNATLQKWSFQYGFDKELKLNVDDSLLKGKMKIYADVFEAYIGGLVTESSDNYPIIYNWLKKLAEPVLRNTNDAVAERVNSKEIINTNAKVELYSLIGYAALGLHYETVKKTIDRDITEFIVQVKTKEGVILGEARGKNVKEAGMKAAMVALNDKQMIEKYSKIRASIPRDKSIKPVGVDSDKNKEDYLKTKDLKQKRSDYQWDRSDKLETVEPSSTGFLPAKGRAGIVGNQRDFKIESTSSSSSSSGDDVNGFRLRNSDNYSRSSPKPYNRGNHNSSYGSRQSNNKNILNDGSDRNRF